MTEGASVQERGVGGIWRHTASRLAWSLCVLSLTLTGLSVLLLALILSYPNTDIYDPWLDNSLTSISYAPVGALIASRHPATPVGWILCLFDLVISISHFSAQYAIYTLLAQPTHYPQVKRWRGSFLGSCQS